MCGLTLSLYMCLVCADACHQAPQEPTMQLMLRHPAVTEAALQALASMSVHPATHDAMLAEGIIKLCFDGVRLQLSQTEAWPGVVAGCFGVLTNLAASDGAHAEMLRGGGPGDAAAAAAPTSSAAATGSAYVTHGSL